MEISFIAFGHPNITAKHRNTLEFTKDADVTLEGDCIIGVNADFSSGDLTEFVSKTKKALIILETGGLKEHIAFTINKTFNNAHEIVIRKTDFLSDRTIGLHADKAAKDLDRKFIALIRDPNTKIKVTLSQAD